MVESKGMELRMPETATASGEVVAATPRIVNGIPVRPPEKMSLWLFGIGLLPDMLALLVSIGVGVHLLVRYFSARGRRKAKDADS